MGVFFCCVANGWFMNNRSRIFCVVWVCELVGGRVFWYVCDFFSN
jgi:hypothetical protein